MKIKRTCFLILIAFLVALLPAFPNPAPVRATTYNTITCDGDVLPYEWDSDEDLGDGGSSVNWGANLHVTWDIDNLYIGINGWAFDENPNSGDLWIFIDRGVGGATDSPDWGDTGGSFTIANLGRGYEYFWGAEQWSLDPEWRTYDGSAWSTPVAVPGLYHIGGKDSRLGTEITIPWTAVGGAGAFSLLVVIKHDSDTQNQEAREWWPGVPGNGPLHSFTQAVLFPSGGANNQSPNGPPTPTDIRIRAFTARPGQPAWLLIAIGIATSVVAALSFPIIRKSRWLQGPGRS